MVVGPPLIFLQRLRYELDQLFEGCLVLLLVIPNGAGWLFAVSLLDKSKRGEGLGFDGLKICFVVEEGM